MHSATSDILSTMAVRLFLHRKPIESVFELLGRKENDLTYSVGWALAQSSILRESLVRAIFGIELSETLEVRLQERRPHSGITDIELLGKSVHLVIEAKRGWNLPTQQQLRLYAPRLRKTGCPHRALVSMSECNVKFAELHLPQQIAGCPVRHVSWQRVQQMAKARNGSHAEKRLLSELRRYLERVVKMQDQESNMVYVVSLGTDRPSWSSIGWIEMVTEKKHYFHKVGVAGWPSSAPNYLGFRYHGRLQSIHHVEKYEIITNVTKYMPELKPGPWKPHFLYWLGPAIRPLSEVRTGRIFRNGRVRAALDLLLTCKTISEARDLTKKRLKAADDEDHPSAP